MSEKQTVWCLENNKIEWGDNNQIGFNNGNISRHLFIISKEQLEMISAWTPEQIERLQKFFNFLVEGIDRTPEL